MPFDLATIGLGSPVLGTSVLFMALGGQVDTAPEPVLVSTLATFLNASPALVTPNIGTPSAGTLTNCTGLPITTGVSGLGASVAAFLATPSSANLATALTDKTGTGANVFADTPTLVTPILGVATATSINKVALTAPATSATLTIANGKTLTASVSMTLQGGDASVLSIAASKTLTASVSMTLQGGDASVLSIAASKTLTCSNTLTFTGTDASSVAFGAGGTVLYSGGALGTPSSGTLTNCTGLPYTSITGLGAGVATFLGAPSASNLAAIVATTGSGSFALNTSPTLVTPLLGTPTSGTLTNCTGLPITTGVSGLGASVAAFLATPSSANLATALTDKTGTGANVFASGPTLSGVVTLSRLTSSSGENLGPATNAANYITYGASYALSTRTSVTSGDVGVFAFYDGADTNCGTILIDATNNNTAYNTTSDGRLKAVVGELETDGEIDRLRPVRFLWKHKPDSPEQVGFVAQEVHAVFPRAATPPPHGGDDIWMTDEAKLMPLVIAELKALRRRVAELEASR